MYECIHVFKIAGNCTNFPVEIRVITVTKSDGDMDGSVATFGCADGFVFNDAASIQCSATSVDTPWPSPGEEPTCKGSWWEYR